MRNNVRICLGKLTGYHGDFSDEVEAFWRAVNAQYTLCQGHDQIPENHIPLWYARMLDQNLPLKKEVKPVVEELEKPIDRRTREGRALAALGV